MPEIKVVVVHAAERDERAVTTGTKAWELFADDPTVIAARVERRLRDLAYELADGDVVEPVAIDSADGRDILRHSTAHVMAQAVQELFPDAKLGIGPPIENGFYYDFDVAEPVRARGPREDRVPDAQDRQGGPEVLPPGRSPTTTPSSELADEPYKLELIGLKGGSTAEAPPRARASRSAPAS